MSSNTISIQITGLANTIIFCTLLVLKLTVWPGVSWWVVFAPFWVPLVISLVLVLVALIIASRGKP